MNQIISHHGWGLDSDIWNELKKQFLKENWNWSDNERGYFSKPAISCRWLSKNSNNSINMAICHSLGTYLINPYILYEASHIVLINSFIEFLPKNNKKILTLKLLKRMEGKLHSSQAKSMLKEFISRSFFPNYIDSYFLESLEKKLMSLNKSLLSNDLKKLYLERTLNKLFCKDTRILIINSKKDLILKKNASDELIQELNNSQKIKPQLIELQNQGHMPKNINIFSIIRKWINE